MRTFPEVSKVARAEVASAVHGGVAVKCGNRSSAVGAQLPSAVYRSSMQASSPVCEAQVAPARASAHGSGSAASVMAIVAGPANPAGALSAVVSGNRNVSVPGRVDSPASGWETHETGCGDLLSLWHFASCATTSGAAQSVARTTIRRGAVPTGVKTMVTFSSGPPARPADAASQPAGSTV